ncbi:hypothetical protein OV203_33555 [Nannocystis sp. ILAH1]|uniref:hypothetical protein n=1 Tax=Nannocystis sp. ILAH1 TaxID=2996789 RepID=UPI0022705D8B|nr:hypothetical protein [Nannocystis sp. ILAH1]MCY0992113.1 hypothetical protein [Nannocystis sp. ILAH1]
MRHILHALVCFGLALAPGCNDTGTGASASDGSTTTTGSSTGEPTGGMASTGTTESVDPTDAPTTTTDGTTAGPGDDAVMLMSPPHGAGLTIVTALAQGPGRSVLVTTAENVQVALPEAHAWDLNPSWRTVWAVHRVEPDGAVAWTFPLDGDLAPPPVIGLEPAFVAALGPTRDRIAVGRYDGAGFVVLDAEGQLVDEIELPGSLVGFVSAPDGITGVVMGDDAEAHLFHWTGGDTPVAVVPDGLAGSPISAMYEPGALTDSAGTLWWAFDTLRRVTPDGAASEQSIGSILALAPRAGEGLFAWVNDPPLSEVRELDGAGATLATTPLLSTIDKLTYDRTPLIVAATGELVIATVSALDEHIGLKFLDVAADTETALGFSYNGSVQSAVVTEDGLWFGGGFSGHFRAGDTTLASGLAAYGAPFVLRAPSLAALQAQGPGVPQCLADSDACNTCMNACTGECPDVDCLGMASYAYDCACRVPQHMTECMAAWPNSYADLFTGCYTGECAPACGIGQ